MIDKWFKKKYESEKDYNTHKIYDIDEFVFDEEIKRNVSLFLKKYRDEFKPNLLNDSCTTDKAMILATLPLIEELKSYYNNDLCISVATSVEVAKRTKFNLRTHAYYAENALVRICNTWEYLFIILNQFLDTDLIVGNDVRNKVIEAKCHNIDFVKSKSGYKPVITPLADNVIEEIKPILKKKHKLFKISTKKKANSFHKAFKKKYSVNDNLQIILQIYYGDDVKEMIELRNEFIHRRPLGAKFSVAPIDFIPAQGIDINPKGWYDFQKLDEKLEKNLSIIRTAIQMLVDIIFSNDVPKLKINESKTFFAYKVWCNNCSRELLINDCTVECFKNHDSSLICPYCKKNDTVVNEKIEVHDRYYFSNIKEYNEFIFENWKNDNGKETVN
ncbi:hypothetical protein [Clostridium butyricum]|uniref:hypothetical protein n=1 Tax=Clostridium butyricum TaxID=1492 RepID=UPI001F58A474|nr:hypothetical protein [Clostridium butyricum]